MSEADIVEEEHSSASKKSDMFTHLADTWNTMHIIIANAVILTNLKAISVSAQYIS